MLQNHRIMKTVTNTEVDKLNLAKYQPAFLWRRLPSISNLCYFVVFVLCISQPVEVNSNDMFTYLNKRAYIQFSPVQQRDISPLCYQ